MSTTRTDGKAGKIFLFLFLYVLIAIIVSLALLYPGISTSF